MNDSSSEHSALANTESHHRPYNAVMQRIQGSHTMQCEGRVDGGIFRNFRDSSSVHRKAKKMQSEKTMDGSGTHKHIRTRLRNTGVKLCPHGQVGTSVRV